MATKPQDFILDQDNDLFIDEREGDFVVDDATEQHQKHIIIAQKGEIRSSLGTGVGVFDFLNDDEIGDLSAAIRTQFEMDGQDVEKVSVTSTGDVDLKAAYR